MDKSEPCLVPFTGHTSAVSHVTCITLELFENTVSARASGSFGLKLFVQKRRYCYRREEDYLFYLKLVILP